MPIDDENAPNGPLPLRTQSAPDIASQACLQQEKAGRGVCGIGGWGQLFSRGVTLCYPSVTKLVWDGEGVITF